MIDAHCGAIGKENRLRWCVELIGILTHLAYIGNRVGVIVIVINCNLITFSKVIACNCN